MPSGSANPMSESSNEPTLSAIMEAIAALRLEVSAVRPLVSRVEGLEARATAPEARLSKDPMMATEGNEEDQQVEVPGESAERQIPHQLVSERVSDGGKPVVSSSRRTAPMLSDDILLDDDLLDDESASELKSIASTLPVFTGKITEYKDWSWQHEVYFVRAGLWPFICGEEPQPDSMVDRKAYNVWRKRNFKCISVLMRTVHKDIREAYPNTQKDAAGLWKQLRINFFRSDRATKSQLLYEFHTYGFKAGKTVKEYAHGLVKLDADLRSRGVHNTEEILIYKLLHSLPEDFETIRYNLLEKDYLTFTEVVDKLVADSERKDQMRLQGKANSANGKPKPKRRNPNQKENSPKKERNAGGGQTPKPGTPADQQPGGSSSRTSSTPGSKQCRFCKKTGHWARDCPDKPAMQCFICNQTTHGYAKCPEKQDVLDYLKKRGSKGQANNASGGTHSDPDGSDDN